MTNRNDHLTTADIARLIALPFPRRDLIASLDAHDMILTDLIDAMIDDLPDALPDDIDESTAFQIDDAIRTDRDRIMNMMHDLFICILADIDPTTIALA